MKVKVVYRIEEEIEISDKYRILEGFSKCSLTAEEEDTIVKCLGYAQSASSLYDSLVRECSDFVDNDIDTIYSTDDHVITEN